MQHKDARLHLTKIPVFLYLNGLAVLSQDPACSLQATHGQTRDRQWAIPVYIRTPPMDDTVQGVQRCCPGCRNDYVQGHTFMKALSRGKNAYVQGLTSMDDCVQGHTPNLKGCVQGARTHMSKGATPWPCMSRGKCTVERHVRGDGSTSIVTSMGVYG